MSEYTKEDYEALLEKIRGYYNDNNVDVFRKVGDNSQSLCDVNQIAASVGNNVSITRNLNGDVIGYDYTYRQPNQPDSNAMGVNSNSDEGLYGVGRGGRVDFFPSGYRVSGTINKTTGDNAVMYSGAMRTNLQQQLERADTIASFLSPTWAAVSGIAKLGKVVSERVYETAPDFFDNFFPIANPETWPYLAHTETGEAGIRALFDIDENGNTTMYMDEDTLGYIAMKARDAGVFNTGEATTDIDPAIYNPTWLVSPPPPYSIAHYQDISYATNGGLYFYSWTLNSGSIDYVVIFQLRSNPTSFTFFWISSTPFTISRNMHWNTAPYPITSTDIYNSASSVTAVSQTQFYFSTLGFNGVVLNHEFTNIPVYNTVESVVYGDNTALQLATLLYDGVVSGGEAVPGVSDQPNATIPVDAITGADPHVIAQNLANDYPQLMGDPVQIVVMDDSCNEVTKNYYSVPFSYSPTTINNNMPITGGLQVNPSFNPDIPISVDLPDVNDEEILNQIILQLLGSGTGDTTIINPDTGDVETLDPNLPNTGDGVTPPSVMPETNVQGVWHVYNPSSSEVSSLGAWLWSTNIIDQIVRIFVNPMEAIIGLHAIYGEPSVGSSSPILVGNLQSTVSARVVNKQYTNVDCGSVWVTEYFGNVFDYSPYTKISIFLPFIGIVDLDTGDIMRSELHVTYNIDVYTGACIAQINVNRDGVGGIIYQYAGQCAIQYPISASSYSRMLQSVVSAGLSAVSAGVATGGNPVAGALAAGGSILSGGESMPVQRSGGFSGNAGAMGAKIPYLIIKRPQTNMAINYQNYDGRGSNYTKRIGETSGYIRCKEVHLNIPGAYKNELAEIERLLKSGIIV